MSDDSLRPKVNQEALAKTIKWMLETFETFRERVRQLLQPVLDSIARLAESLKVLNTRVAAEWRRDWDRSNRFFSSHPDMLALNRWLDSWYGEGLASP